MDVWERDLLVVQILGKYNDNYKYLVIVIDITKFLHIVQLRSKTGTDVTAAFWSVLPKYSKLNIRPILVRINRGKKFLNRSFQDMLKKEGIQFQVCRDPNVK